MRMGSFFTTGMLPGLQRGGRMVSIGGSPSTLPPDKTVAATLTPAELLGGLITLTLGGAANIQLPTAQAIKDYLPSIRVGDRIACRIVNKSGAANTGTITTNTGATLVGTATVAQNASMNAVLVMTNVGTTPTYSAYL